MHPGGVRCLAQTLAPLQATARVCVCVRDFGEAVFFFFLRRVTSVTLLYHSVAIGERLAKEEV